MWIFLALLVGAVSLLFRWLKYQLSYWDRRGIPHDVPQYFIGNYGEWRKTKTLGYITKSFYDKYRGRAPFAGVYIFFSKFALILDLDLLKNIMIKDFSNFEDRGIFHNERDDPLSGNLFNIEGHKWRTMRQKLTPTFTSGKMKYMFPTVVKVGQQLSEKFKEKVSAAESKANVLELTDLVARFTADVIGTCAFGIECNSLKNPLAEFVVMGKRAVIETPYKGMLDFLLFGFPKLAQKLRLKITVHDIEKFYMGLIKETVAFREKHQIKRNDFMDMLIEMKKAGDAGDNENGITLEELAAQAFIFLLAGFETSSTTMGFALYEMALNQEVQKTARKEVRDTLAKYNNEFTYECIKDMHYLEQVIDETLRMHPIVPDLNRKAKKRYETGDPKYYIEAGTYILISVLGIHYNPDIYPEPHKFKPERFTAEEITKRPACSYLPFGDGPRVCIGLRFGKMQATIGLAYLLKDFEFNVAPETQVPLKYNVNSVLLSPENGIYLKVNKI